MKIHQINADLPPFAARYINKKARYKVMYGGRGKAATWTCGRMAILEAISSPKPLRFLCTRELQSSIKDSVHRLLKDQINLMGLQDWFSVTQADITCVNGSNFIFKGLKHNTEEVKSMEGIDRCLVEEAEKMSANSWDILIPTIRKDESQIWVNFNPDLESDPTYQRFVVKPPPDAIIQHLTYRDNPWFPKVLEAERLFKQRTDPDGYLHVWEGKPRANSDAQIFKGKWEIGRFEKPEGVEELNGADWGFSQDPTVLIVCWIIDNCLYIGREFFQVGLEINHIADAFKPIMFNTNKIIRADSARPETISYVKNVGKLNIIGADKWKGSVEDGIAHLKSFDKIYIHEECKHMIEEARQYAYKVSSLTGDILTDIIDKNNHGWDAVRYALSPIIKPKPKGMFY